MVEVPVKGDLFTRTQFRLDRVLEPLHIQLRLMLIT